MIEWPGMRTEYAMLAPAPRVTSTGAHQIGIGFSGHEGMVREVAGRSERCDAWPGSVYVTGADPITWLEVVDPIEALEVYPDPALVRLIAGDGPLEVAPALAVRDGAFFAMAARLRSVHRSGQFPSDIEASTLAHHVVGHLVDNYGSGESPDRRRSPRGARTGSLSLRAVDTVAEYIDNRTRTGHGGPITLDSLATTVGFSSFHFARLFKATTGMTPHAYVTEHRMMVAKDRLLRTDETVAAVASAVGFGNVSHFRRTFRRQFGVIPAALRVRSQQASKSARSDPQS